jgi:RNA polymerase sigma-70 factor (ECF subfamily)
MDDHNIIQEILDGEINKFELLIEKYNKSVFRVICKRVPFHDQEQTVQEVFIKAFQSLSTFNIQKPFENWLITIAVRSCYDYWREQKRKKQVAFTATEERHDQWLEQMENAHSIEKFEAEVSRKETLEMLEKVMKKLSPEDRLLVDLIYFEGWKLKEAAEILNWKLNKTKVRAMRARKKLRKEITGFFYEQKCTD